MVVNGGVAITSAYHGHAQTSRDPPRGDRADVLRWEPGAVARLALKRGALADAMVRVVARGRTRLVVQAADGRRYRVPPGLLGRVSTS